MTIRNTLGYACAEAESAEAALARMDSDAPDLILTDLKLPNMSGVELLKQMKMLLPLQRMAEKVRLVTENEFLRERVTTEENLDGIIGSSANIKDVLRMISRLKDTRTPVLIAGESGTGKELAARAIHFRGSMAQTP